MDICCISDTHNKHDQLDLTAFPADVLICAGDITSRGTLLEVHNFMTWFHKQPFKHKILVPGNHDFYFEKSPELAAEYMQEFPDITLLQNSGTTIEGHKIWGSADTPVFHDFAFNKTDAQLQQSWDSIPDDTEVLVTHGPPKHILDRVSNDWSPTYNVGDQLLRNKVLSSDIAVHVFGHIHEQGGKTETVANIKFVNAAVLDYRYHMTNAPVVITI